MTPQEKEIARQGGTPPPTDAFEQLHGDSSPINGRYKTWFWAFPPAVVYLPAELDGDAAGAWKLLDVLLDRRPSIKNIIDSIDVPTLASNMYHTHYYEGVHDPRQPGGVEQNIADYAHALSFTAGAFTHGLADWNADGAAPPATPTQDLTTALGVQRALNALHVVDPPLAEDGVLGPKTRKAIMLFQSEHGLKVDGIVGPKTRAAFASAQPT
jgi:hypothetical protein